MFENALIPIFESDKGLCWIGRNQFMVSVMQFMLSLRNFEPTTSICFFFFGVEVKYKTRSTKMGFGTQL